MKTNIAYFFGALGLMALASCSSDDDNQNLSTSNRIVPVSEVNVMTRAGQDVQTGTTITKDVQAGFFITDGSVTEQTETVQDNIALTATGDGGFSSATQLFFPLSKSAGVYAYAPYQSGATLTAANTFTVQTDQSEDGSYLASDLLIGAPADNPVTATDAAEQTVALKFDHKLSKVNINVEASAGYDLSTSTIRLLNTRTSCTFDVKSGTVAPAGATEPVTAATYTAAQTAYKCAAIIVPQTVAAGKQFLVVDMGSGAGRKSLYVRLDADKTFESGHEYTYNVKISGTQVTMTLAGELNQWTSETPEDVNAAEGTEDVPDRDPQVGDWYTAAGKFVDGTTTAPANTIGIVFSTTVSAADAAAGYKAYVSALSDLGNTKWTSDNTDPLVTTQLTAAFTATGAEAVADLNGLTSTTAIWAKLDGDYANLVAMKSAKALAGYGAGEQFAAPATSSGWFVPSVGQLIQLAKAVYETEADVTDAKVTFAGGYTGKGWFNKLAELRANDIVPSAAANDFLNTGNPTYWTVSESDASSLWLAGFNEKGTCSIAPAAKAQKNGKRVHLILAAK